MDFDVNYIGQGYDRDECEIIATSIPIALLKQEAKLYSTKWFDYRTIHHVQATYLFVHHYNVAYGRFHKQVIDRKLEFKKAISGGDLFMQKGGKGHRELSSFIRMRQKADEFGIPYSIFCRAAINHVIALGWVTAPRPSHLNKPEVYNACLAAWDDARNQRIHYAENNFFTAPKFCGHADQIEYQSFIVDAIKRKSVKHYALASALYEHQAITEACATDAFSSEVLEQVKACQ